MGSKCQGRQWVKRGIIFTPQKEDAVEADVRKNRKEGYTRQLDGHFVCGAVGVAMRSSIIFYVCNEFRKSLNGCLSGAKRNEPDMFRSRRKSNRHASDIANLVK